MIPNKNKQTTLLNRCVKDTETNSRVIPNGITSNKDEILKPLNKTLNNNLSGRALEVISPVQDDLMGNVRFTLDLQDDTPSPRCLRTRPSPSRERGEKKECIRSIHLRERGNNKLSPSPVGEKVRVAGMRGKGFTLIELLVVVLIIAILAAVALPQYQKAVLRTKMIEALTLGRTVMDAQKVYYLDHGAWADNFEDLDITIPNSLHYDNIAMWGTQQDPTYLYPRLNISSLNKEPKWAWNFWFVPNPDIENNHDYIECYCNNTSPLACSVCQNITGNQNPRAAQGHTTYTMPYQF